MSLSNPTLTNPAQHFIEWSGSTGKLSFYDKERQESIPVPLPFSFIVLDQLSTITGYSDPDQSGFWSNEVRNILKDELNVRTKRGTRYVGLYKNDQGMVQLPQGARYTKSIYIAHQSRNGLILGNLKLAGAALTSWIEFTKNHAIEAGKISITGMTEGKKGATTYQIPTFEWGKWTDEEYKTAVALDKELQIYLSQYLSAPKEEHAVEEFDESNTLATPEQVADFEQRKAEAKKQPGTKQTIDDILNDDTPPAKPDTIIEDIGDEPINLDDIPF